MRVSPAWSLALSLAACGSPPRQASEPPPPPAFECAAGRVAQGDRCVSIDEDDCPPPARRVDGKCVDRPAKVTPATPPPSPDLKVEILRAGSGATADVGSEVSVHYDGTLVDGTPFDSSRKRGAPFSIRLGENRVIKGWEEGLVGMRVGELRRLTIGPDKAYGARGRPPVIPPAATLVFEIELLSVK